MYLRYSLLFLACLLLHKLPEANAQVVINEFSAANFDDVTDNYGDTSDWIELYNMGATPFNLAGYYLSDRADEPTKWAFPAGTTIPAGGYLMVWASGRNTTAPGNIHTNFSITQTRNAEAVVFSDPTGSILDINEIDIPNKTNHSIGRVTDGSLEWGIFVNPTPSNTNANAQIGYAETPEFDTNAGRYPGAISVAITSPDPTATIYYTTNGNEPTNASTLYTGAININATTVIRAIAYSANPNLLPSFVETNTYFINENHTVKIVSVCGNNVDELLNNALWGNVNPVGSFELFQANTFEQLSEAVGDYNKHGNDSWAYNQRGFDYVTRDEFGYDYAIKDQIFPNTQRDKFQRLILKPAANDNYPFEDGAHIRDAYVHTLSQAANLELDERSSVPCVVYLNGQYWGVYEIREKVDDKDFIEEYYNVASNTIYSDNSSSVDYIKTWGATWSEYGTETAWNTLHNYIVTNNMANAANYQYVKDRLNVLSLVDYIIINTQTVCSDWLNYNTGWWHTTNNDVKWRYTLWDMDATFGHYINYTGVPSIEPDSDPCDNESPAIADPEGHIDLLQSLFENDEFFDLYINRYADLNSTYFSCDYMLGLLDQMIAEIEPEMPRQINRWGGSYAAWQNNVQELRDFISTRCTVINVNIADCYDLEGPFQLTVQVEPAGAGTVTVNTVTPTTYPYQAEYFGQVTITLTATPAEGGSFSHWEANNGIILTPDANSTTITINLSQNNNVITAYFGTPIPVVYIVEPAGTGIINVSGGDLPSYPYTATYNENAPVVISATPNAGYTFTGWEATNNTPILPNTTTAANAYFAAMQPDTIIAHFSAQLYDLTLDIASPGTGTLAVNGTTISTYPTTNSYGEGVPITIEATPPEGYEFDSWEVTGGNIIITDPTSPSIVITLQENSTLIAHFTPKSFNIDVVVVETGNGTVSINGNNTDNYTATYGETVNLTATPAEGYMFVGWTTANGSTPDSTNPDLSFTTTQDEVLTATFALIPPTVWTVVVNGGENGSAVVNGETVSANGSVTLYFNDQSEINLTATPADGYMFVGWWQSTAENPTGYMLTNTQNLNFSVGSSFNIIPIFAPKDVTPKLPTAFSPNGDTRNDVFKIIKVSEIQKYKIAVYDRWGNRIFYSNNPSEGWDGTYKGGECEVGTYSWFSEGEVWQGDTFVPYSIKGNVALIR